VVKPSIEHLVEIPADGGSIKAIVTIPPKARGIVLVAQAASDQRHNLTNRYHADRLRKAGFGTLLTDLLTPVETGYSNAAFDIRLLTRRLEAATLWLIKRPRVKSLPLGYLVEGTATAAALYAAADLKPKIKAIVSCNGRPDLAFAALPQVDAPTLFIAAAEDCGVARINQRTANVLSGDVDVEIMPGTNNLFEEPAIEEVARLACRWFRHHLRGKKATRQFRRK
jgi:putative phosphoribosyl transferase